MSLLTRSPAGGARAGSGELRVRHRLAIRGLVQGVGFRPFVFRLATELELTGWVANSPQGVSLEIEGEPARVQQFLLRLEAERPPHSHIQSLEATHLDPIGFTEFDIRPSADGGERQALILPDIATCPECLREVFDPANRRFRYPFTNCTHCGPRYSIVERLPYDRPNTSMAGFTLCPACRAEYEDPRDRRFHAQPNACPACGPRLELWSPDGRRSHEGDAALREAGRRLLEGDIVAVKGLGGFHLMVLAADEMAVRRLRERKGREAKPLALLFRSLESVRTACAVSPLEARLLESPEAPIVLLRRRAAVGGASIAPSVAPGNPYLGAMLPCTPLHHLLLEAVGAPVVATSGNRSDEPLCTDEREALERLAGIADWFLVHNRPIVRHLDDSVVRVVLDREMVLRRARGYAPLPIPVREDLPSVLALGAQLKNTVALAHGRQVFLSQHIGDLETAAAHAAFQRVVRDLPALHGIQPEIYAADAHPDYLSAQAALATGKHVICVQHHYAHVLACMAENDTAAPLLGVSWDGTGFGVDQTIWGGEFLRVTETSFERVGHLRWFRLPGGEAAIREPRRTALGLLYALWGDATFARRDLAPVQAFTPAELRTVRRVLAKGINSPVTTSAGRLFDAVASLLGLRQTVRFEGQAAMDLEFALEGDESDAVYRVALLDPAGLATQDGELVTPCPLHPECRALQAVAPRTIVDWVPLIEDILIDLKAGVPVWEISAKFHNTLAEAVVAVAQQVGDRRIVLTGGCFQNRYLLERTVSRLRGAGFSPYWHQRVPPNDGGIALGQVMAAARTLRGNRPGRSHGRPGPP